jgi:membrane protein implicated in regulation of membrane protease activity
VSNRRKTKGGQHSRPSPDQFAADFEIRRMWVAGFLWCAKAITLGLVFLLLYPVVKLIAGKETIVDVNLALTATVAVTLSGLGALQWGRVQKARADRLQLERDVLANNVKTLQKRLRKNGLPPEIEG